MEFRTIETNDLPYTSLLYCSTGIGKSTAIGLIAEQTDGNTLVIDVDKTITRTLAKEEVVKDTSKIMLCSIDNANAWESWDKLMTELKEMKESGELEKLNIKTIAVDNISELEHSFLTDLGAKGKNNGTPAMGDYQHVQFRLVRSLRFMKSLGLNIIWTAWETVEPYTQSDGTMYSRSYPKVSAKIVDNICGLCDVVGRIFINKEGEHGIRLEASPNVYAKNQIDSRKACRVEDFTKFKVKGEK